MFWLWVAVWVALVVLALAFFALLARLLWVKAGLLLKELGEAGERVAILQETIGELEQAQVARREGLAVFADPGQLRAERVRRRKALERAKAKAKVRAARSANRSLSVTGDRRSRSAT